MKRVLFLFSLIMMLGICANADAQVQGRCVAVVHDYDPDTELIYMFSGFKTLAINNPYLSPIMENGYAIGFKVPMGSLDVQARKADYWEFPVSYVSLGGSTPEPAYIRIEFAK